MNTIDEAVSILQAGGLVAIPTETVYGLAADAKNPEALRKIFAAKGRPADHPVIVHIADSAQLRDWAVTVSDDAALLAKTFWPGPLTLILKKKPEVSDLITGGQDTVGVRVPSHPVAQAVLKKFGSGVAAPSANRFGRISPTTAAAVREELGDRVDCILEGGSCEIGVESTIVDVSGNDVVILRPGMISTAEIEATLKKPVLHPQKNSPRVSGALESHYSPRTSVNLLPPEMCLEFLATAKRPIAFVTRHVPIKKMEDVFVAMMPEDVHEYAHDLYATLRELDRRGFQMIVIEDVPRVGEWECVRDRLGRM